MAGMTEQEFWHSTVKAVLLKLSAHSRATYEEWQRVRWASYVQYCLWTPEQKRVSIFKLLPLSGDPSEEELLRMEEEANKRQIDEAVEAYNQMKNYL